MNNMKILISFALLLLSIESIAQKEQINQHRDSSTVIIHKKQKAESYMIWQIKSLSEFIARFNYEVFVDGQVMNDSTKQLYPREQYLMQLFNEDDSRFLSKKNNSPYYQNAIKFITLICETGTKIPEKPIIYASLTLNGAYLGKHTKLKMSLEKLYNSKDSSISWQITNITIPHEIKQKLNSKNEEIIDSSYIHKGLNPNAQDVAFTSLVQQINEDKSIITLLSEKIPLSKEISLLENSLQNGDLHIINTSDISLNVVINKIYQVELQAFIREKENSGWLISNLITH
jgi:hypothetical protein